MDILNIIFGVVGIAAFIFSLYSHFKMESKKVIEAEKRAMDIERIRNSRNSLLGILNSVDSIVQIPKKGPVKNSQLQDLARVARSQIMLLSKQLSVEESQMENWRYGQPMNSFTEKNGN